MKPDHIPPRFFLRFFRWYCHPTLVKHIEGDLMELYHARAREQGNKKADIKFVIDVLLLFRPGIIRNRNQYSSPQTLMLMNLYQHYVVVAFRNIRRHKSFAAINISGLALGMICCFLIFLWVRDEKGIDNFHAQGKNIYGVYQTISRNGKTDGFYTTPLQYTDTSRIFRLEGIEKYVPEIENVAFYAAGYDLPWGHAETFQVGDKIFKLEGSRANENFLTMFSYPLLAGDAKTALRDLHSVAISKKMAMMFFESPEAAIGKSIRFENQLDLIVTAVFADVTSQSSLQFDYLISWATVEKERIEFASDDIRSYVLLKENADVRSAEENINRHLKSVGFTMEDGTIDIGLQPFGERYLYSNFENGKPAKGRIVYVRIFSGVAIFILIIAAVNFMNLATARSIRRAKEVGVRKVVGSSRFYLINQFLGESILLSFVAFVLSMIVLRLILPLFNTFTGKHIVLPVDEPTYWISLIAVVLVTGFVAGSYPALFLSSLRPARVLKGVVRFTGSSILFRKGLSVFQFALSITLLIATIVVSLQTDYVQHLNLGYDRENLIYIRIEGELNPKYAAFKAKAEAMPGIAIVDRSSETPHSMGFVTADPIHWEGQEENQLVGFKPASVGFDFVELMDLKVAEGRGFSRDFATDSADAFLVNEEAVKQMNMKDPIGKWVSAWRKKGHIIGVLKNYHTGSMHEKIVPVIIDVKEYEYFGVIMVRTEPGKTKEALASLEKVCKEINPNYPFAYQFVDQEYAKLYKTEELISKLTNVSAVLAILISSLGLLGLVMFSAEQRTKEFGIRKVLGASLANIAGLLSKDFIKLVCISFCLAAPLAGYFMYEWLQGFAFKIDLSWWIFALAGGTALLMAMLTISFQAVRAALVNPVDNLKSE
ncbi:MAG TPA: ABC transporter permease [Cyclobacteriaceae bacterium]|nr:ABC transporter permease [Cyclobacteriaceae bacterium]